MKAKKRKNQSKKVQNFEAQVYSNSVIFNSRHLLLSFFLPIAVLGTVFALHQIYPFGYRQILIHDLAYQYYPFFSDLWHKLRNGTLSSWSWVAGAGHDYVGFIAYYLASPLNILALLAPLAWLREMMTLIILLKIGCAGLFMAIFLRSEYKQNRPALAFFSSLYALCAFSLGYYLNIMWLDNFALLPLVIMGFLALMRGGNYKLYICTLALAVFSNFYIGFFICVFVVIAFFGYCIIQKFNMREFLLKLRLISTYSAIAIGMTAVLLLPAYSTLQNVYRSDAFSFKLSFYKSFFSVLGNFAAFNPPTVHSGLPNLYCGIISVLLAGVFFASNRVSLRTKIVLFVIIIFYLFSCNFNILDYMMHGFHNTNGFPFRFSFLISFILVIIAYRAFLLLGEIKSQDLFAMSTSAALILFAAFFGSQEKKYVIGSAALCIFYLILFFLFTVVVKNIVHASNRFTDVKFRGNVIKVVFFLLIIAELSITAWIGVNTVETTSRTGYPNRNMQVKALLQKRRILPNNETGNDFYRTEKTPLYTENDSSQYSYNGLTFFSSTLDNNVAGFLRGLGLIGSGAAYNFIGYNLTSPLCNAFLAMRYMISVGGIPPDIDINWEPVTSAGDALMFENKFYLPLGFMVNKDLAAYAHHDKNSFLSQNDLFRLATGLDGILFASTNYTDNVDTSLFHYLMQDDGVLYANFTYYNNILLENDIVEIYVNGVFHREINVIRNTSCITVIGKFLQDDLITFKSENGSLINVGFLNTDLFKQGYALLADEPFELTTFSNTKVSGTVTAFKDGILYTSIPGRNWNVCVDGVKNEVILIDKAMAAVRLCKGTHSVEFRYNNISFTIGVIISLASAAVFALLVLLEMRKRRNHKEGNNLHVKNNCCDIQSS